jgi:hypothetical protein
MNGHTGLGRIAVSATAVLAAALGVAFAPPALAMSQSTAVIAGTMNLEAEACATPSPSSCVAVGYNSNGKAVVVPSSDVAESVPGLVYLNGIACPSASTCLAISQTDIVPVSTSGAVGTPTPVADVVMSAIACEPGGRRCIAVGAKETDTNRAAIVPISATGQPGTPVVLKGKFTLDGVSCPSAGRCVAVGNATGNEAAVMATIAGTHVTPTVVSGAPHLDFGGVACTSDTSCVAIGTDTGGSDGFQGVAVPLDPADNTFGAPSVIISNGSLGVPASVACPPGPACFVSGFASVDPPPSVGLIVKVAAATGEKQGVSRIDGTATLIGIACPAADECVADGLASNERQGAIATVRR